MVPSTLLDSSFGGIPLAPIFCIWPRENVAARPIRLDYCYALASRTCNYGTVG